MGLGRQIGPGLRQAWSSQGQIGIDLPPNRLEPLEGRATELVLLQGRCNPLLGRRQQGQLLLQGFAETVDDEKANIAGPPVTGRAQALPLGPGGHQLAQETVRQLTGLNRGPEGAPPGAAPIERESPAIEGIDRSDGLEATVGVAPLDGRCTGPDPQEHGPIQAGNPLKGQGLEGELAAARQVSLDQLGLSFCPHGQPQIRQGQVLGGPLVEPGLALEAEGSGPPLQVHRDRHPAAIQPGRQQPFRSWGQGLHAQAPPPGSIAKPFAHPGFVEAKGPGHRLVQTQLEIWGEG